jgi:hypothetical protein
MRGKATGEPFDHLEKYGRARSGATRQLDRLKRLASDERLSPEERAAAQDLLSRYSDLLDAVEEAARKAEEAARAWSGPQ